jgi:hypothetical protein
MVQIRRGGNQFAPDRLRRQSKSRKRARHGDSIARHRNGTF